MRANPPAHAGGTDLNIDNVLDRDKDRSGFLPRFSSREAR